MNVVTLIGRVGQQPETIWFDSGSNKANCSIAVSKYVKGEQQTTWINLEAWGKTAEVMANYVRKGSQIAVEGEIATSSWDDRETGKKRYSIYVRVNRLELLDKKGESETPGKPTAQISSEQTSQRQTSQEPNLDEIPF